MSVPPSRTQMGPIGEIRKKRGRPRSMVFKYFERLTDNSGNFLGNRCSFCDFISKDRSENSTYLGRHLLRSCNAPQEVRNAIEISRRSRRSRASLSPRVDLMSQAVASQMHQHIRVPPDQITHPHMQTVSHQPSYPLTSTPHQSPLQIPDLLGSTAPVNATTGMTTSSDATLAAVVGVSHPQMQQLSMSIPNQYNVPASIPPSNGLPVASTHLTPNRMSTQSLPLTSSSIQRLGMQQNMHPLKNEQGLAIIDPAAVTTQPLGARDVGRFNGGSDVRARIGLTANSNTIPLRDGKVDVNLSPYNHQTALTLNNGLGANFGNGYANDYGHGARSLTTATQNIPGTSGLSASTEKQRVGQPGTSVFDHFVRRDGPDGEFLGHQCKYCSFISHDKTENGSTLQRHLVSGTCSASQQVVELYRRKM